MPSSTNPQPAPADPQQPQQNPQQVEMETYIHPLHPSVPPLFLIPTPARTLRWDEFRRLRPLRLLALAEGLLLCALCYPLTLPHLEAPALLLSTINHHKLVGCLPFVTRRLFPTFAERPTAYNQATAVVGCLVQGVTMSVVYVWADWGLGALAPVSVAMRWVVHPLLAWLRAYAFEEDGPVGRAEVVLGCYRDVARGFCAAAAALHAPRMTGRVALWVLARVQFLRLDVLLSMITPGGWALRSVPLDSGDWGLLVFVFEAAALVAFLRVVFGSLDEDNFWRRITCGEGMTDVLENFSCLMLWTVAAIREMRDLSSAILCGYLPKVLQAITSDILAKLKPLSVSQFSYEPLRAGEFRILIVKRNRWGLAIISTRTLRLSSNVEFEVISCHGRESSSFRNLVIDGSQLKVPAHVFDMVHSRCSMIHNRNIWIENICVSEIDAVEPAARKSMIQTIHSKASRILLIPTVSWRSRLAVSTIYAAIAMDLNPNHPEPQTHLDVFLDRGPTYMPSWQEYRKIINSRDLFRTPVLREIIPNPLKVQLCLGGLYVPWEHFVLSVFPILRWNRISYLSKEPARSLFDSPYQHRAYEAIWVSGSKSLTFRDKENELVYLDKLIAELVFYKGDDDAEKVKLAVDLTNSMDKALYKGNTNFADGNVDDAETAAKHVARCILTHPVRPSVDILSLAGNRWPDDHPRDPRSPTWTPRLSLNRMYIPFTQRPDGPKTYNVSKGMPLQLSPKSAGSNAFQVTGILCCYIQSLCPVAPVAHTSLPKLFADTLEFQASVFDFVKQHNDRGGGGDDNPIVSLDAVARTLCGSDAEPSISIRDFQTLVEQARKEVLSNEFFRLLQGHFPSAEHHDFVRCSTGACLGRRFGITRDGRACLVPPLAGPGDWVVVLHGAQTPCILRRSTRDGKGVWEVVGEAYVSGLMHGQGEERDAAGPELTFRIH